MTSVVFFGVGGFGGIALKALLDQGADVWCACTRVEKPLSMEVRAKRFAKRLLRVPDFEQILFDHFEGVPRPHELGVPVMEDMAELDFTPDYIISAGFPKLIPQSVLRGAQVAAINFHPGILPKRAGATPSRTAILEGDEESALTVHHMTEHFDSGETVWERRVPITKRDTFGTLENKIARAIPEAMADVLTGVNRPNGTRPKAKLCPKVQKLAYDWSEPPELISRKIRSLQPRSCIPVKMNGSTIAVWEHDVTQDGLQIKSVFDGVGIRPSP